MAVKRQNSEFRYPAVAAFLQGLTDEEAAKLPVLSLEQDGVVAQYWREGGRVRCHEREASGSSGVVKAPASRSSAAAPKEPGATGRRQVPTPCSLSNAA